MLRVNKEIWSKVLFREILGNPNVCFQFLSVLDSYEIGIFGVS